MSWISIMTDWTRVHGFHYNTYVQEFPVTSFLLAGVSNYQNVIQTIEIGDILTMEFEPTNAYDSSAIVIKRGSDICGYVSKDCKEKMQAHVPCNVRAIDKRRVNGIFSLRVDTNL